jgi:hypothetical protein
MSRETVDELKSEAGYFLPATPIVLENHFLILSTILTIASVFINSGYQAAFLS